MLGPVITNCRRVAFKFYADRNHGHAFEPEIALQQRMPGVAQNHPSRHLFAQLHGDAVVFFGEACLGKLQLQLAEHFDRRENCLRLLADAPRHLEQNAMNLRLLFVEQAHQFVVLLDRLQRLDKNGLAARTGSMHHALHAPFLLNLYGDDKALAADRHQLVLHRAVLGQRRKYPRSDS